MPDLEGCLNQGNQRKPRMPDKAHRANTVDCVGAAILTISDTRTPETDESGALIRTTLEKAGHRLVRYEVIPDEADVVRVKVLACCSDSAISVVLLTGGTGIASRDTTYEAVEAILEKRIDGFGELFRALSYQEIGAAAMLSRAVAGVCRSAVVFSMPGSVAAVRLAMDRLILPELGHVAALVDPSRS